MNFTRHSNWHRRICSFNIKARKDWSDCKLIKVYFKCFYLKVSFSHDTAPFYIKVSNLVITIGFWNSGILAKWEVVVPIFVLFGIILNNLFACSKHCVDQPAYKWYHSSLVKNSTPTLGNFQYMARHIHTYKTCQN